RRSARPDQQQPDPTGGGARRRRAPIGVAAPAGRHRAIKGKATKPRPGYSRTGRAGDLRSIHHGGTGVRRQGDTEARPTCGTTLRNTLDTDQKSNSKCAGRNPAQQNKAASVSPCLRGDSAVTPPVPHAAV